MPLFEFACVECGNTEEHVVFQSDKEDVVCGVCGTVMMKAFPDSFRFKLLYDPKRDSCSWGNEGYAVTQRYRETNKLATGKYFVQPGVGNGDKTREVSE